MQFDEEFLEEVNELMENGAGMIEVFEYIQDHTDVDPFYVIEQLS